MTSYSHFHMPSQPQTCPRCGQGHVCAVRIDALEVVARLCDECDALWVPPAEVAATTFLDFGTYMTAHGRTGEWAELTLFGPASPA